jgi:DNA-binding transcriptional LysR family regulator
VSTKLAEGIAAVPLSEPAEILDTRLMWRHDDASPTVQAFRSAALAAFK